MACNTRFNTRITRYSIILFKFIGADHGACGTGTGNRDAIPRKRDVIETRIWEGFNERVSSIVQDADHRTNTTIARRIELLEAEFEKSVIGKDECSENVIFGADSRKLRKQQCLCRS